MTIARVYYAPIDFATGTDGDQDVFHILAPSDKKIILHGFSITSNAASAEAVELSLLRRSTLGTGETGATEVKADTDNGATIGATVYSPITGPGTAGDILAKWKWSQQGELLFLPTPEIRPIIPTSGRLALHLGTAPAATRDWNGWVAWEEL